MAPACNEKLKILYITFVDFDKAQSGSSVRPQNMYRAFLTCGYDVKLLKGQQNKRKRRRVAVREVLSWLDGNRPDICYVEPPTGPFFNYIDHRLMTKVRKLGIPTGLFYRDAYWRYGLVKQGKGLVPTLKAWVIKAMQKRDLRLFKKNCDIVYLTSASAAAEWDFKKILLLPPGCNIVDIDAEPGSGCRAIYVGGVNERYGTFLMLDAFKQINSGQKKIRLKLVCRKKEWDSVDPAYRELENTDWLEVMHIEGEALFEQYRQSDFALCPLRKDIYNDMAMPIKLMEYVAYCKPVVATDCVEMSRFINENEVGVVTEYNTEDFAKGVREMAENEELRKRMIQNCLTACEKHSWVQRAKQVAGDLTRIRG